MISSDSQSCDPSKLQRVEGSLKRTYVSLDSNGDKLSTKRTSEYDALRHIVQTQMKGFTEQQLIYNGVSIESFIRSQAKESFEYPTSQNQLEINQKCKHVSISSTEYVIFDPFTGSLITYNNLKSWFKSEDGGTKGTNKTTITSLNDPCNYLPYAIKKYKTDYPLPSPMWRLQTGELKGVRTRFMKLLSFLLVSLEKMYENVKRENTTNFDDEMKQVKDFYKNLLKSIDLEPDPIKKKKLVDLKSSVETKFGNGLKKLRNS